MLENMNDPFSEIIQWIDREKANGHEMVSFHDMVGHIRDIGRKWSWKSGDIQDDFIKLLIFQLLAGMFETPLRNAPRYVTTSVEMADMTMTIAVTRPLGTTPIAQHDLIADICRKGGWVPEEQSLSEFIYAMIGMAND